MNLIFLLKKILLESLINIFRFLYSAFKKQLCFTAENSFIPGQLLLLSFGCIVCSLSQAQTYNVMNAPFNAAANGSTDDRAAILLAIDSAHAWSLAHGNAVATVYFPSSASPYLIKTITVNNPKVPAPDGRARNYIFPVYSNLKFEGASASGSRIKLDSGMFSVSSWGNIDSGTGKYFNANLFYGNSVNNVSNITFKNFTIDFNGANNCLPTGQNVSSNANTGQLKTIYGILINGGSTSSGITVEGVNFQNNPGRNDVVFNRPGDNLTIKNCTFRNGGRNVGSTATQNVNHHDFSFVYSDWTNTTLTGDSVIQEYPEISLQGVSNSGGVELHASNSKMYNNYIYGCKPGIFVAGQSTTGTPLENILIRKNQILDCAKGIFFWIIDHIDTVTIDSNTVSLMFIKVNNSLSPPQVLEGKGELAGVYCARGDMQCRINYEYDTATVTTPVNNPGNLNLNTISNVVIRQNNFSFDSTNSLAPTDRGFTTAGVQVHSFHNSRIDSNTISKMNWAGIVLQGSPWGTHNLSIKGNRISDFQYSTYIAGVNSNWSAFLEVTDYYRLNSDCNPYHNATYRDVTISGNIFTTNTVTNTEATCSANGYNCFKNMYFNLPTWYAYKTTPVSPYSANIFKSEAFTIQSGGAYDNYLYTADCTTPTGCITNAAPTDIHWYSILASGTNTIEKSVDLSGSSCLRPSNYSAYCNVGYRLLVPDGTNQMWTVEYWESTTLISTSTKYGNQIIITRGVDYPVTNVASSKIIIKVNSRNVNNTIIGTFYTEERLVGCIDPSCTPVCNSNVIITGTYSIPNTESSTWIKDSGVTIITNTANVRLDAKGTGSIPNGYAVEMIPANNNEYFLAAPANEAAVFVAQPSDGCGPKVVARPALPVASKFSIYPNPASGSFIVVAENTLSANSIQLFDINGSRRVITVQNIAYNKVLIRCNNVSKGVYLLKVNDKNKMQVNRVVIL